MYVLQESSSTSTDFFLVTKDLDSLCVLLLLIILLWLRLIGLGTEHELSPPLPVLVKVVLLLNLGLDQVTVVLQVGSVTSVRKGDPSVVLKDGRSVVRPSGEVVCVLRSVLLHGLNDVLALEEDDSADGGLEHVKTPNCALYGLVVSTLALDCVSQGLGHEVAPVVIVISAEEQDKALGFGVERRRGLAEDLAKDSLDLVSGEDLGTLGEGVGGSSHR